VAANPDHAAVGPRRELAEAADVRDVARLSASRPDVARLYAVLVLLKEQPCHGYELGDRLSSLGVDAHLGQSLYRVLRDMESRGLVTSVWDLSELGGPPRRVYTITEAGDEFLADATAVLVHQRFALGQMLARYRELSESDGAPQAATG
jgi:DNA-binding PadR family transcriptional regulator